MPYRTPLEARLAKKTTRAITDFDLIEDGDRVMVGLSGGLESARLALGQAEENLRIRNQQFDVGRATSEDVLDAQALLERQRATLARALYDAHTRRAELQQLMGLPLDQLATAMLTP